MKAHRRRVVVTGIGIVSPGGSDPSRFWQQLVSGSSSVRRIQRFDASGYPSQIAAEVPEAAVPALEALPAEWISRGRIARFAAAATELAVEDAALAGGACRPQRLGLALAAGMGSYDHEEIFAPCIAAAPAPGGEFDWRAFASTLRRVIKPRAAARQTPGSIAARLAVEHECGGPVAAVMTACAGGTQAIGDAARWIRMGLADAAIAGAADSEIYPMGLASFCLLGALSRRNDDPAAASRPFEAGRDGFVIGEGAAMLVLEEREHAVARGARILSEVAGFGSSCDAYRATDPHPDGLGAVLAMSRALDDAGLGPGEIDYINAHGTSTVANDRIETRAIARVFGDRAPRIPISSTKSMIGHATVAAGAIEAVVVTLTLANQAVHPTINMETRDPDCDLDYVPNHARRARVRAALSNSFAFGGQCAALVFREHDE